MMVNTNTFLKLAREILWLGLVLISISTSAQIVNFETPREYNDQLFAPLPKIPDPLREYIADFNGDGIEDRAFLTAQADEYGYFEVERDTFKLYLGVADGSESQSFSFPIPNPQPYFVTSSCFRHVLKKVLLLALNGDFFQIWVSRGYICVYVHPSKEK